MELAARDFVDSHKPDYDLSSRVNKYTNWEGELNEIVHYSKANIRGIEILVNLVISDYCGDTKNIETIFNPHYRYFGCRIFNHDLYDYCVVVVYAEEIYSTLNSTLYTSQHIDEEMLFERETLGRRIAEKNDYAYSERYARDHPNVRFSTYLNSANRSKRLVRLNEYQDGDRTFTVLRRDSLERNPGYKYHDDADYLYTDERNERYTHVPEYQRIPRNTLNLGRGERIVRQSITDVDKEVYTKHYRPGSTKVEHEFYDDPHKNRYKTYKDFDSTLYYGSLNDVTRFEEDVIDRYSTYHPETCTRNKGPKVRLMHEESNRSRSSSSNSSLAESAQVRGGYFRERTSVKSGKGDKISKMLHKQENKLHKEVVNSRYTLRSSKRKSHSRPKTTRQVDLSFREEPAMSPYSSNRTSEKYESTNYGRYTSRESQARPMDPPEIKKTESYDQNQRIGGYRMVERDTFRNSNVGEVQTNIRTSRVTRPVQQTQVRTTISKATKHGAHGSPEDNFMNRPTSYSSAHKRKTKVNSEYEADNTPFDIDNSF